MAQPRELRPPSALEEDLGEVSGDRREIRGERVAELRHGGAPPGQGDGLEADDETIEFAPDLGSEGRHRAGLLSDGERSFVHRLPEEPLGETSLPQEVGRGLKVLAQQRARSVDRGAQCLIARSFTGSPVAS